ncbi:hypothetical protein [Nonlabens ponticola]|uniref:Heat-shock protein Hsp90 n=1 Tax=Nonlabens ponticola TaxID=2496866 RepID=A0A3S9MZU9_9FLAO|nr:hypothetical protein [Nonlabens ponticola]AZQ44678.1 hypothetical protein EJ995_10655 [Nonlabens ponticola]
MKSTYLLLCLLCIVTACKTENKKESDNSIETTQQVTASMSPARELVNNIERAHGANAFADQEMVSFDINLDFGGKDRLDGTIYMTTDSKYARIEKTNGDVLLYDGNKVWLSPKDANQQGARFDIFTWTYFFALPFKLSDDGAQVEMMEPQDEMKRVHLSFESGTGDAPDDWYDLYVDDQNILQYAGYIVTYGGTPAEKAVENAHAIGYQSYKNIEGVQIAHDWKFYNYDDNVDTSNIIGEASLKNVEFRPVAPSLFKKPDNAVEISL